MGNVCQQADDHVTPGEAAYGMEKRLDRFMDQDCSFIDSDAYSKTQIYKSDALYHKKGEEMSSSDVKEHIRKYTKSSKFINDALNADNVPFDAVKVLDKSIIAVTHSNISSIFRQKWDQFNMHVNIKLIRGFITVFRGARLPPHDVDFLWQRFDKGKSLRNRAFLSCSFLHSQAVKFQDIYVQTGKRVLFSVFLHEKDPRSYAYVKSYSNFPEEEEVIVRPCRRFKILRMFNTSDVLQVHLQSDPP